MLSAIFCESVKETDVTMMFVCTRGGRLDYIVDRPCFGPCN